MAISGCAMSQSLEESSEKVISMTLCQRTKQNFSDIAKGFKIRELYRTLLYFVLMGSVVPSFADYFYYY